MLAVAVVTAVFLPFRSEINSTTVSLAFLLIILLAATLLGRGPALLSSFLAGVSLNFFFLPPYYTLTVAEPQNWVALIVFMIVAITVGQLSAKSRQRAEIAEKLYADLEGAFERASETEAIRRSEKLKTALLDAITHDLRTPLTSIKAATTLLLDDQRSIHSTLDPEGQADLLEVITEETDRLNTFVDSMVGVARIEAGSDAWQHERVHVGELITNVLERAAGTTAGREIEVQVTPNDLAFNADSRAMGEVLYNLIDNAVKYSPRGTTIRIAAMPMSGGTRIVVEDEGPGIPVEERDRIFEKFYRGERSGGGFGLGLAIVRGIIEAHGGTVRVEESRRGAKFVIDVPMRSGG